MPPVFVFAGGFFMGPCMTMYCLPQPGGLDYWLERVPDIEPPYWKIWNVDKTFLVHTFTGQMSWYEARKFALDFLRTHNGPRGAQ